ncbi:MAG TPA: T9SS type A sorting domain-containing protein, partial [Flavisolibacter sp.]|nr:T9SS type A sorting domain-containing protein [Flavisolibacter sp.]
DNRAHLHFLYDIMEQANNDMTFVQLQPCGSNMITSAKNKRSPAPVENKSALAVEIWPNPSPNLFNLRFSNSAVDAQVQVRVLDVHGKQVYAFSGNSRQEYKFGGNFIPGLYFVEVTQGNTRSNFKIIKQ